MGVTKFKLFDLFPTLRKVGHYMHHTRWCSQVRRIVEYISMRTSLATVPNSPVRLLNNDNDNTGPGMAPTLCSRCGDAVDEGCDPKDELAKLNTLLKHLRFKRYDLKRKVNRYHSPIIRHLPPDVMSTIFEFCLPYFTDNYDQFLAFIREDFSFPLSLGAVCSYWRAIAWSIPSLWSSLVVRVTSSNDPHIIAGVAQEWLARSGQLPLTIRILAYNNKPVSALSNIINRYSTRWSHLDLCMPPNCFQHFFAIGNHAPTLKSIRFHSFDDAMSLNFLLTCPRLERATLEKLSMNGFNIQWDNLTHLTLQSMSTNDVLLILRKTPRLVFCRVSRSHTRYVQQNIEAFVLSSLRSLHLPVDHAEDILNNMIAPHLEELSYPSYHDPSMQVITSFLRRSACSLRSFSMAFIIFPPHFESCMIFFRSINTLSITSFFDYKLENHDPWNILQLLAKVLSSQSSSLQQEFLPNLKILEFTGELRVPAGNLDALYTLPPADNPVRGPLHLFKLDLHPITRVPQKMMSYLSSLEERGVTVNVLSDSEDILQSSIDYYRRREESLCRDWADNLDSSLFS